MKIIKQHGNISRRFQINTVQGQTSFNDHAKTLSCNSFETNIYKLSLHKNDLLYHRNSFYHYILVILNHLLLNIHPSR